jgi:hypothetical protein
MHTITLMLPSPLKDRQKLSERGNLEGLSIDSSSASVCRSTATGYFLNHS